MDAPSLIPDESAAAPSPASSPVVVSTWPVGMAANEAAWQVLSTGGSAMDAVVAGAASAEDDPAEMYVGFGGLPDASGQVTLDASVMDGTGRCGAVACMRRVRHAARVARLVMERTPHVLIVGDAATRFAVEHGFDEEDLLTPAAAEKYRQWVAEQQARDQLRQASPGGDYHDTIGVVALDAGGNLAGACSTSGLAFKLPGRVGDSPIIGAGLYVEAGAGAAAATGDGEEVIKVCGSYAAVRNMARGMGPHEAIAAVLRDLLRRRGGNAETHVSFVALRADGAAGGLSLRAATNYRYAVRTAAGAELIDAGTVV